MKNWKVWQVIDERNGKVLFEGRKKDCVLFWYPRWCYERLAVGLIQTDQLLTDWLAG